MSKYVRIVIGLFSAGVLSACGAPDLAQDAAEVDSPIIGGTTDNGDPSVVAIFAHAPTSNSGSLCTGTVISSRAVLTAAHCVDPRLVGSGNVFDVYTGTVFGSSSTRLAVSSVAFDAAFNPNALQNGHDIAVVTLAKATTLPPVAFNRNPLTTANQNLPVRLVGYGASTHTNTGAGTKRAVTTTVDSISSMFVKIGSSSQQTCHGDSGGPALQTINGVDTIIGITSFGSDNSSTNVCNGGGYDSRVDQYSAFITAHL